VTPYLEREREKHIRATIESSLEGEPAMLPAERAARAMGISRRGLYDLVASGELVSVKHGAHRAGRVVVPRSAVIDFLVRRAVR
jgi:hypothetical protein